MKTIFPTMLFMLLATLACSLPVPTASSAAPTASDAPTQVSFEFETLPSPTSTPNPQCVVSASVLNMRTCAGTQCAAQAWLREGDVLTIRSTQSQWIQVVTRNNITGWVYSKFCVPGE